MNPSAQAFAPAEKELSLPKQQGPRGRKKVIPPVSPRSDIINNSLHPVGLSGPTSFQFSPSTSTNSKYSRENYISFVSSDRNVFEQHISNSGSPVKSIGGNISSSLPHLEQIHLKI